MPAGTEMLPLIVGSKPEADLPVPAEVPDAVILDKEETNTAS